MQGLARGSKRCLAGMKEVAWAVGKPGRTKVVLLARNIQIPSPDCSLLQQVLDLVHKCTEAGVPVIMGPTRKNLGMAFRTSGAWRSSSCLLSPAPTLQQSPNKHLAAQHAPPAFATCVRPVSYQMLTCYASSVPVCLTAASVQRAPAAHTS